jgi:hypothetical protein
MQDSLQSIERVGHGGSCCSWVSLYCKKYGLIRLWRVTEGHKR